jgi:hypothetical protein
VPQEPGEQNRKLPERADALRIDLPFEEAVEAALKVKPPPKAQKRPRQPKT